MHTIVQNKILYVYRSEDHMMMALSQEGSLSKMYAADFAFDVVRTSRSKVNLKVIKDRSGAIHTAELPLEKMLKTVKILMEKE